MKYLFITIVLLNGAVSGWCQDSVNYEEQFQQEYLKRIQKSYINGFYIPQDLSDGIRILDEIVDEAGKKKFSSQVDSVAVNKVFFSFGRWINVNWGMEQGSRLTVSLNKLGVSYPDDMTRLIMYAYHKYLNGLPLDVEALVDRVVQERLSRDQELNHTVHEKP